METTILGYPRIGGRRELKKATELWWAGRISAGELEEVASGLRRATWETLRDAGLDAIPSNTFSLYEHVLDMAVLFGAVPERFAGLSGLDAYFAMARGSDGVRRVAQAGCLPILPTTTIGSFPQTESIRKARADHRARRIDDSTYQAAMHTEIDRVIALQEDIGLDVLVHGEPERNDMVQYFAERLDGFAATDHGWVQSYGTRYVRPPILHSDVNRPGPITVNWTAYAQSRTSKPVKGMLTGPVTMLAWSFVRDDQPLADTARQVALAIREEISDLEAAGIRIIQVDEPALRELLPLRRASRDAYLGWAVDAFRLATSGAADSTQIHTHMCYSEFGEIIGAINDLDADVTSIEAARSRMEFLADLRVAGYERGIGPGIHDIHSPRVPATAEMTDALRRALETIDPGRLWVNPDCGLKTRSYAEAEPALRNLVAAAHRARASIDSPAPGDSSQRPSRPVRPRALRQARTTD